MARLIALVSSLLVFVLATTAQPKALRVPNDHATIQAAINAATNGDTVLVAEGTYFVNLVITKKIVLGSHFLLDGDTSHISRTILNGSLPSSPDSGSVILVSGAVDTTLVITGFTITGGKGTRKIYGSWIVYEGGGIGVFSGGITVGHNIIRQNAINSTVGAEGGGIYMDNADGPISHWIIEHNIISDNTLYNTSTVSSYHPAGAGVSAFSGTGRISNNVIIGNRASALYNNSVAGGLSLGVWNGVPATVSVSNNYIGKNEAGYGAAIAVGTNDFGVAYNNTVFANNIVCDNIALPDKFTTRNGNGAAVWFLGGTFCFINNTFANNSGAWDALAFGPSVTTSNTSVKYMNNIMWNPSSIGEHSATPAAYIAQYNLVRGGMPGQGNFSADPTFVAGDTLYALQSTSPCINAGMRSASIGRGVVMTAPAYDFVGLSRPRPAYTNPDLGATENSAGRGTLRVPQDHATIQAAINAAVNGDTVLVDEGTYFVNLFLSKKIVLASRYLLDRDTSHISRTILDGSAPRNADSMSVIAVSGEADSTTHITGFTLTRGGGTKILAPVDPVTFWTYRSGGAISVLEAGVHISHNIIRNNRCEAPMTTGNVANDPAISIWGDLAWTVGPRYWIIEHNVIRDNVSTGFGAEGCAVGVCGTGRLTNNLIVNNRATGTSHANGAVVAWGAPGPQHIRITDNIIRGNSARTGAALSMWAAGLDTMIRPVVTLQNNMIVGNGQGDEATIATVGGSYRFINNTIADNFGTYTIMLRDSRGLNRARFLNNVIWNPAAEQELFGSVMANGDHNIVRGGMPGTANIDDDPLLVAGDTLHTLSILSPAIGAGVENTTLWGLLMASPVSDLLGTQRPRPAGSQIDLGAIEHDRAHQPAKVKASHPSGNGSGCVWAFVIDSAKITDHIYRVRLSDTSTVRAAYDVVDVTAGGIIKVHGATQVDGCTPGPEFDGIRLLVKNGIAGAVDTIGWVVGSPGLKGTAYLFSGPLGAGTVTARAFPYDYAITIGSGILDTSAAMFDMPATPMKFTVWNLTRNEKARVLFADNDANMTLTSADEVHMLEKDHTGTYVLSWGIQFVTAPGPLPAAGDQFLFRSQRPFTPADVFEFAFMVTAAREPSALTPEAFRLAQNYPNPFNPETRIGYGMKEKGWVKLSVMNILGQQVAVLVDEEKEAGYHEAVFSSQSSVVSIPSGVYFYRISVSSVNGQRYEATRKMVMIK